MLYIYIPLVIAITVNMVFYIMDLVGGWHLDSVEFKSEERKVIYVGGLEADIELQDIHDRFEVHGKIINIDLYFRISREHFAFITYQDKESAAKAIKHGNDNKLLPQYNIHYGCKRLLCVSPYMNLGIDAGYDEKLKNIFYENSSYAPFNEDSRFERFLRCQQRSRNSV